VTSDLEQQLGLVSSPTPCTNINNLHLNIASNNNNNNASTNNNNVSPLRGGSSNNLLSTKFTDYSFGNGPRSLSDSSQAESPLGSEEILPNLVGPANSSSSNGSVLGNVVTNGGSHLVSSTTPGVPVGASAGIGVGDHNANNSFSSLMGGHHHHHQTSPASYNGTSSNIYLGAPVLPASLLYSQVSFQLRNLAIFFIFLFFYG